ncbi:MAG TPA: hypothetical protein VLH56_13205, partial [Dissulfurispiraceae bacterium]|nr:hypothetical protein [Dissulfurispiraceae bacterium]
SLCGSAGSISGDVLTWIDPSFSILEPLRESFLAVHFASRVFQQPVSPLISCGGELPHTIKKGRHHASPR